MSTAGCPSGSPRQRARTRCRDERRDPSRAAEEHDPRRDRLPAVPLPHPAGSFRPGAARRGHDARGDLQLFVQTKLWVSDYGYDEALRGFEVSARKLGLDTVDLYLLHQPLPQHFDRTIDAYRAAERLLADGRVRAIGVSNFSAAHLDRFLPRVTVAPAVNQVEVHPYYNQPALRAFHDRLGIVTQAWSPLGGVYVYRPGETTKNALDDPAIAAIAARHVRSPAQVILRWHLDGGRSAVPKSVRPERIAENLSVFDFALTPDEIASIDALDTGVRGDPTRTRSTSCRGTGPSPNEVRHRRS